MAVKFRNTEIVNTVKYRNTYRNSSDTYVFDRRSGVEGRLQIPDLYLSEIGAGLNLNVKSQLGLRTRS